MSTGNFRAHVLQQRIYAIFLQVQSGNYDYDLCKQTLLDIARTAKEHHLETIEIDAIAGVGNLNSTHGNFDEALEETKRSYERSLAINYIKGIDRGLNNMGVIYSRMGDRERTLAVFLESLELTKRTPGLESTIFISYMNVIGELLDLNRDAEAESYMDAAMAAYENMSAQMRIQSDVAQHIGTVYSFRAQLMLKQGRYPEALSYAKLALEVALASKVMSSIIAAELTLLRCLSVQMPNTSDVQFQMDRITTLTENRQEIDSSHAVIQANLVAEGEYWLDQNELQLARFFANRTQAVMQRQPIEANQVRLERLLNALAEKEANS